MLNLKEISERKKDNSINIAPPKSCDIEAGELIPSRIEEVKTTTPFSNFILERLGAIALREKVRHNIGTGHVAPESMRGLITQAASLDQNFLRWDLLRRETNTGFEGYGAGSFDRAQDIALAIANMGVDLLVNAKKSSNDPMFLNKIWETLLGVKYDPQASLYLEGCFGSILARLRAATADIPGPENVRKLLTNLTATIPNISYDVSQVSQLSLPQSYRLPSLALTKDRLSNILPVDNVNPSIFKGNQQYYGYLFMMRLGVFGHPLVRAGFYQGIL